MSSCLRQKRFRRYLFTEQELQDHAEQLAREISPLERRWRDGGEHPAEIIAEYIFRFLRTFRPRDFMGGPHSQELAQYDIGLLPKHVALFAVCSFRSTPLAVNRSLVAWAEGRITLALLDRLPSAEEILREQAQFRRVVTCVFHPEQLVRYVEGLRDPLGFVMHDLIHADHFFRDRAQARAQQDFYIRVLQRYASGEFSELLAWDAQFANEFAYVIGDMNSHPAHLQQTLEAIKAMATERRVHRVSQGLL